MKNLVNLFLLVLIVCMSCEEQADLTRVFSIRKGEHYASPRIIETLQAPKLEFSARFNQTARYRHDDAGLQDSKNKLLGFSDCNSTHHENSARFVWQWYNDELQIFAYCYVDGNRVEEFVGVAELNQFHRYSITISKNAYTFRMDANPVVSIPRGSVCETGVYYKLWPYFGGSVPAPHDICIEIKTH